MPTELRVLAVLLAALLGLELAARVFEAECEALPEAITRHFAARG